MKTAAGVTYTYDGDGERVEKSSGTLYWFGVGGEVLEETDLAGNWTNDYIYFAGQRMGRIQAPGPVYLIYGDLVGSARAITTSTGTLCYDADFYPFGGERVITNTCGENYKFTGMERDSETGNDHTLFRQHASNLGRWLSPDPAGGNVLNPQSLNRYAYVLNNPTTFTDPLGLCEFQGRYYPPPCLAGISGVNGFGGYVAGQAAGIRSSLNPFDLLNLAASATQTVSVPIYEGPPDDLTFVGYANYIIPGSDPTAFLASLQGALHGPGGGGDTPGSTLGSDKNQPCGGQTNGQTTGQKVDLSVRAAGKIIGGLALTAAGVAVFYSSLPTAVVPIAGVAISTLGLNTALSGANSILDLSGNRSFRFPTVVTYIFGPKLTDALGLAAGLGTGANPSAAMNAIKVLNSDTSFHQMAGCGKQGPP